MTRTPRRAELAARVTDAPQTSDLGVKRDIMKGRDAPFLDGFLIVSFIVGMAAIIFITRALGWW